MVNAKDKDSKLPPLPDPDVSIPEPDMSTSGTAGKNIAKKESKLVMGFKNMVGKFKKNLSANTSQDDSAPAEEVPLPDPVPQPKEVEKIEDVKVENPEPIPPPETELHDEVEKDSFISGLKSKLHNRLEKFNKKEAPAPIQEAEIAPDEHKSLDELNKELDKINSELGKLNV